MAQISIEVNGRPYMVGCEDGQERHLTELGKIFDAEVRKISAEMGQLGDTRLFLMGALLALEFASTTPVDGLILWQPVTSGRACINQFLRQRLTSDLRRGVPLAARSTAALRTHLMAHGVIEVNGYDLAAPLPRWLWRTSKSPAGRCPGSRRSSERSRRTGL